MKKWTIILMTSLLMLSACQSDESDKGDATTKTKVEQEKSNKEENISKESAKKIEQTVNNAVKVSAFGWDIVNEKEAYVQFLVKKNGKWEEGYVKTIEESDQFEPKEVKVVSIDDEKSLVTILYKDAARGNLGVVSHYIIKSGKIEHIEDFQRGTYLQEEMKELNEVQLNALKEKGYITQDSVEKGMFISWSDYAIFLGYDKTKDSPIIKEIQHNETIADVLLGKGNYIGITIDEEKLAIKAINGENVTRELDKKTSLENVTIPKGSNVVFLNSLENATIHSDIYKPNAFFENTEELSTETLLKGPILENVEEGIYLFAMENFKNQQYNGFQLIVE